MLFYNFVRLQVILHSWRKPLSLYLFLHFYSTCFSRGQGRNGLGLSYQFFMPKSFPSLSLPSSSDADCHQLCSIFIVLNHLFNISAATTTATNTFWYSRSSTMFFSQTIDCQFQQYKNTRSADSHFLDDLEPVSTYIYFSLGISTWSSRWLYGWQHIFDNHVAFMYIFNALFFREKEWYIFISTASTFILMIRIFEL